MSKRGLTIKVIPTLHKENELHIKTQSVPRSKHSPSLLQKQLMLYREIIAVCSEIHTKQINTAVWAERRVVNVKLVVHIVTTVRYI